ncbi:hypothetical protein F0562_031817 [Nyssa sinensis]|uniref:Uncharacterized protein n=1 Tax=Nyssa sinensis TaxID=561372 RepID=A0A5J5AVL8_9ASTE|nr:hypothetical protein F0562_031817 [Nyssa sinensis]
MHAPLASNMSIAHHPKPLYLPPCFFTPPFGAYSNFGFLRCLAMTKFPAESLNLILMGSVVSAEGAHVVSISIELALISLWNRTSSSNDIEARLRYVETAWEAPVSADENVDSTEAAFEREIGFVLMIVPATFFIVEMMEKKVG